MDVATALAHDNLGDLPGLAVLFIGAFLEPALDQDQVTFLQIALGEIDRGFLEHHHGMPVYSTLNHLVYLDLSPQPVGDPYVAAEVAGAELAGLTPVNLILGVSGLALSGWGARMAHSIDTVITGLAAGPPGKVVPKDGTFGSVPAGSTDPSGDTPAIDALAAMMAETIVTDSTTDTFIVNSAGSISVIEAGGTTADISLISTRSTGDSYLVDVAGTSESVTYGGDTANPSQNTIAADLISGIETSDLTAVFSFGAVQNETIVDTNGIVNGSEEDAFISGTVFGSVFILAGVTVDVLNNLNLTSFDALTFDSNGDLVASWAPTGAANIGFDNSVGHSLVESADGSLSLLANFDGSSQKLVTYTPAQIQGEHQLRISRPSSSCGKRCSRFARPTTPLG